MLRERKIRISHASIFVESSNWPALPYDDALFVLGGYSLYLVLFILFFYVIFLFTSSTVKKTDLVMIKQPILI